VTATGLNLFKELLFVIPFLANLFACTGLFIPFVFIAKTAMSRGVDKSSAVFLLSVIGQLIRHAAKIVVTLVTFFNHNFVNCKATLIWRLKVFEIKYNISLNDVHT